MTKGSRYSVLYAPGKARVVGISSALKTRLEYHYVEVWDGSHFEFVDSEGKARVFGFENTSLGHSITDDAPRMEHTAPKPIAAVLLCQDCENNRAVLSWDGEYLCQGCYEAFSA